MISVSTKDTNKINHCQLKIMIVIKIKKMLDLS